jgi:glutaredoxin 3
MPEIEIYTQAWCPYCERAVHLLNTKGRTSAPQIFIGGQHIGGCDELMALDRAGKLDPLLGLA